MKRPFLTALSLSPLLFSAPVVSGSAIGLVGCGAQEDGARASLSAPEDEAGSTRASRETERTEVAAPIGAIDDRPTTEPLPPPRAAVAPLSISRLEGPTEAEDGAGNLVSSERAVAIDLPSASFPPRALDPVLTIGAQRFVHYRHPRLGVLRFIAASPELLVEGSAVSVRYGEETPTVVSPALSVPAEVRR